MIYTLVTVLDERILKDMSKSNNTIAIHRLLIFDRISRRVRGWLALLLIVLLLVGVYDQFTGYLSSLWLGWWLATFLVGLLYFYYAILMRRASIQVRQGSFRLQGPLVGYNISVSRIYTVTSSKMEQHFSKDQLSRNEWSLLKPIFYTTCLFIELRSTPRRFARRRLWFPRILFGPHRMGLICYVEDWMALSQELEHARSLRQSAQQQAHISSRKTLVGRILAEDIEFR
jgi:hypothetical protein